MALSDNRETMVVKTQELDEMIDEIEGYKLQVEELERQLEYCRSSGSLLSEKYVDVDRPAWVAFIGTIELLSADDIDSFGQLAHLGLLDPIPIRCTREEIRVVNMKIQHFFRSPGVTINVHLGPYSPMSSHSSVPQQDEQEKYQPVEGLNVVVSVLRYVEVAVAEFPDIKEKESWGMMLAWDTLSAGLLHKRNQAPSATPYSSVQRFPIFRQQRSSFNQYDQQSGYSHSPYYNPPTIRSHPW